jgi:hypothetical protein
VPMGREGVTKPRTPRPYKTKAQVATVNSCGESVLDAYVQKQTNRVTDGYKRYLGDTTEIQ